MEPTLRRLGRDDKDLRPADLQPLARLQRREIMAELHHRAAVVGLRQHDAVRRPRHHPREVVQGERRVERIDAHPELLARAVGMRLQRSEEHTSELQSLMRTSYAVFCLKKKKK